MELGELHDPYLSQKLEKRPTFSLVCATKKQKTGIKGDDDLWKNIKLK
jgi:hypothetical protein